MLAGFIANHLVHNRGEGVVLDVLLGIVGAVVGGWLAHLAGAASITRLNLYSVVVATAAAVVSPSSAGGGTIVKLFLSHKGGITIYEFDPTPPGATTTRTWTVRPQASRKGSRPARARRSAMSAAPGMPRLTCPICILKSRSSARRSTGGRARRSTRIPS